LEDCSSDLESAAWQLSECQPYLTSHAGDAEALAGAWNVRRSFVRARKLMESAAAFHEDWTRMRGAMSGGYTPSGDPGPVVHQARISLQA
jgi:hypothetical protein